MPEISTIESNAARSWSASVYPARADADRRLALVLAHGAGAGRTHPFMVDYARASSERGVTIVTFNFPYMERGRRMPDRRTVLEACYREVLAELRVRADLAGRALFIGGKSMGGRMATYVAADMTAEDRMALAGVVLLGYPLHPPGQPDRLRAAHLPDVGVPMLFVQGTRDSFGTPSDLECVLAGVSSVTVWPVPGGDHSFKIPARAGSQSDLHRQIQDAIVGWMADVAPRSTSPHGAA